jgi:hypothetical protein
MFVLLVSFLEVTIPCIDNHSCMIADSSLHCRIARCTVVYIPEIAWGLVGKSCVNDDDDSA